MAVTVKEDIINGSSLRRDRSGTSLTRVFNIYGIEVDPAGILLESLTIMFSQKGITIGSVHPLNGLLFVSEIIPEPFGESNQNVKVVVNYKTADGVYPTTPNTPVIRFTATTRQVTTNYDRDRNIVKVRPPKNAGKDVVAQIPDDKAFGILSIDVIINNSPSSYFGYMNNINSAPWLTFPKWSWWCRDVDVQRQIGISGWRLHMEFELDTQLYVATSVWRDPTTNFIPETIPGTIDRTMIGQKQGYTNSLQKDEQDFNRLPFTVII